MIFSAIAGAVIGYSPIAAAAPGNLNPPFDIGINSGICQGYDNARVTHYGADALALDLTGGVCDNSAAGRSVHAPLAGQIYFYGSQYGALCVNTFDNRSIMLVHIDSALTASQMVSTSQIIGAVAQPNTKGNNGIAHLHMQMWSQPNCMNSYRIPFASSVNARICGAPDMTVSGPDSYNNGTWSGTIFTSEPCTSSLSASAAAVYRYYSPVIKRHLYTTDQNEANYLTAKMKGTWNYEGIAYYAPKESECDAGNSVYRFYSASLKAHLYTMDENERAYISSSFPTSVWAYEGVAFCADKSKQTNDELPVYRFYSRLLKTHLYTNDENEKDTIIRAFDPETWSFEGISYYAYPK